MFVRRCFALTRSVYSFHQSETFNNKLILQGPRKFNFFSSLRVSSSSTPTEPVSEIETKSSDEERMLKDVELEISLLHDQGRNVPDPKSVTKLQWEELLTLESKSARRRFYNFLFKLKKKKENQILRKQEGKDERERKKALASEKGHIDYSLKGTTFMLRIDSKVINIWRNNRLRQAMQFGQKLVFDCSYDKHMTNQEAKNAAKQLTLCFAENRKHLEPYDLHFCNTNFNSECMRRLEQYIPTLRNKAFPLNLHEESYLDLFPKQQLVYLTPHCREDMEEFDHDAIYIIGAMVDKMNQVPLSLGKAKELNLKMARLPLDNYLDWGPGGGKCLTLDQMMRIMLDLKKTGDWEIALRHVPRRKLKSDSKHLVNNEFEQNDHESRK